MVLDSIRAKFPTQDQRDEFVQEALQLQKQYQDRVAKYDLVTQLAKGLGLLAGAAGAGLAYRKGKRELALGILLATPSMGNFTRGLVKKYTEPKKEQEETDFLWKVYNLAKEKGAEKVVVPTGKVKAE